MKQVVFLLSTALAAAYVAPKAATSDQTIHSNSHEEHAIQDPWGWEAVENFKHQLSDGFDHALNIAEATITHVLQGDNDEDDDSDDSHHHHDGDHGHHGHHGDETKTIYELIKESKYTKRFAELVEEHDDIKKLLQDTKANHTLFVPTDKAFERIPPDHKKPPAEFIRDVLAYSITPGLYPVRRLFHLNTLPTDLKLASLGDRPQRLRVTASIIFGVRLNFFVKIVAKDIVAKNGLIHGLDHILIPPPSTSKIIELLPNTFSTFSLALEKTGLGKELEELTWTGGTAFVPTNRAFAKLGPRANAFLFSEHGKKYLKALLKYSIVANETLYSDAFYREGDDDKDGKGLLEEDAEPYQFHVDLPSLLDEKPIHVDITRWKGFVRIVANGFTHVVLPDGVAKDGVLQVVGNVLIPPHKHRGGHGDGDVAGLDGEVSEEELRERLDPYLSEDKGEKGFGDL